MYIDILINIDANENINEEISQYSLSLSLYICIYIYIYIKLCRISRPTRPWSDGRPRKKRGRKRRSRQGVQMDLGEEPRHPSKGLWSLCGGISGFLYWPE